MIRMFLIYFLAATFTTGWGAITATVEAREAVWDFWEGSDGSARA